MEPVNPQAIIQYADLKQKVLCGWSGADLELLEDLDMIEIATRCSVRLIFAN